MIQKLVNFLVSLGLWCHPASTSTSDDSVPHLKAMQALLGSTVPCLERDLNLIHCGGGGSMPDNIKSVYVAFTAQRRSSLEEARQLIVYCTEKIGAAINNDETIRPYLAEYPFPASRIEIAITFMNQYGDYCDGSISHVFQCHNMISYDSLYPLEVISDDAGKEVYTEALSQTRSSPASPEQLATHQALPYEDALDEAFASITKKIRSKWGVCCLRAGGNLTPEIDKFAFLLCSNKKMDVVKARKMAVGISELILAEINSNEKLRPYLDQYPFPVERTEFRVEFWKSSGTCYRGEPLFSVSQNEGRLQYHTMDTVAFNKAVQADPILRHDESYTDAQAILSGHNPKNPH